MVSNKAKQNESKRIKAKQSESKQNKANQSRQNGSTPDYLCGMEEAGRQQHLGCCCENKTNKNNKNKKNTTDDCR